MLAGPLSSTTGVATLRRDGFACLTAVDDGATVLTRSLRFSGGFPFANLVGAMNWTVLAEDGSPLPPFLAANSRADCAATAGAVILPAAPGFYHRPKSIADLVDFVVARICDQLGVQAELTRRWGVPPDHSGSND